MPITKTGQSVFEKDAAIWGMLGKALMGAGRSAGNAASSYIKAAPGKISTFMQGPGKQYANRLGNFASNAMSGRQMMTGWKQMRSGFRNGNLRQGRFNAGLKNFALGAGKTGLMYGGAMYGGAKMYNGLTN